MARPKKEQPNRSDGLYEVKITIGKTMNGSPIRKSFYSSVSKEDAREKANQYKTEMAVANATNTAFVTKDVTFGQWAQKWLEVYKKPNVSENTYRLTYQNTVNTHIIPYFGDTDLKVIRPVDIQSFYATKQSLSKSMLDKISLCLNGIFDSAIDNDLCYKNPAKSITYTSNKSKRERVALSDEQMNIVEKYAMQTAPEIVVLLYSGLRRGEMLGLKHDDIDMKAKTISVKRSIADKKGGGIEEMTPKWNSYRIVPMHIKVYSLFKSMIIHSGFLFTNILGNVQSPNTWSNKFDRIITIIKENYPDFPDITPHDLRHTYGTYLRRQGMDVYSIQKILGHKDIKMTTELYVHNELDTLVSKMDAINKKIG